MVTGNNKHSNSELWSCTEQSSQSFSSTAGKQEPQRNKGTKTTAGRLTTVSYKHAPGLQLRKRSQQPLMYKTTWKTPPLFWRCGTYLGTHVIPSSTGAEKRAINAGGNAQMNPRQGERRQNVIASASFSLFVWVDSFPLLESFKKKSRWFLLNVCWWRKQECRCLPWLH